MGNESNNYIMAVVLSLIVLVGWQYFVAGPQIEQQRQEQLRQEQLAQSTNQASEVNTDATTPEPSSTESQNQSNQATQNLQVGVGAAQGFIDRDKALQKSQRIKIETPSLSGSINLQGARIDDLHLTQYKTTLEDNADTIILLSPKDTNGAYYAEQGWTSRSEANLDMPSAKTLWQVEGNNTLSVDQPVTLTTTTTQGLTFKRKISVDDKYLFSIEQSVENKSGKPVTLYPYSLLVRHGKPQVQGFFILHEGLVGILEEESLVEMSYDDIEEEKSASHNITGGWLGITDKYWATSVIPPQNKQVKASMSARTTANGAVFQTDYIGEAIIVPNEGTTKMVSHLFAGAKEVEVIDNYTETYQFKKFHLMIDWGWFEVITKPLSWLIHTLFGYLGNMGLAILGVTVIVKLVFFPLANKSYKSMSMMKKVQPEMLKIQERYKDDRAKSQQEIMALYKREKINPLAGCWPMLVQIPVFFALYKVIFISIELRHAPFFGWIQDLSAPDPTSILNLFGLLPFDAPTAGLLAIFSIGIWPVLMGITMFIQMKLNPPPTDKTQAMVFNFMPLIFTFMLGTFPAGLVIYWAWNNFLSIIQQYVIMRGQGVDVDLIGNIRKTFTSETEEK